MKLITLTQGKKVIVDDIDFEFLNQWKWYLNKGYAVRGYSKRILMHRFIINTPKGMDTDHINGDKLDNRRNNLRVATRSQNMANRKLNVLKTSNYLGVCLRKQRYKNKIYKYWIAQISFNNQRIYLGEYKNEAEASKVYNQKAQELFGEFAKVNTVCV